MMVESESQSMLAVYESLLQKKFKNYGVNCKNFQYKTVNNTVPYFTLLLEVRWLKMDVSDIFGLLLNAWL